MSLSKTFALIFSIVTILFVTSNSFGQAFMWQFGVEGGAGIRSLRFDPKDSVYKTDVGFMGGIAGQYNFNPTWSLKLGVAYERKGAKFEESVDLGTTDVLTTIKGKTNVDYISIPLLVKAQFGTGKKVKFFVNAGPYLGILLANKTKIDAFGSTPEQEVDNKDSTKKTDFGIAGGLGVDFLVGTNMSFTVEARDNFGLTNINDRKATGSPEIKTNSAQLILGFAWKFGKSAVRKK